MKKVQIIMDENKIRAERKYDLSKIYRAIDSVFVGKYGLVKDDNGFYIESGRKNDFADFWNAILLLKSQEWFLDNVRTWLWFNSDDSSDPEDFAVEDIREHYLAKARKTA
jgi:virulence-associated protein VapD